MIADDAAVPVIAASTSRSRVVIRFPLVDVVRAVSTLSPRIAPSVDPGHSIRIAARYSANEMA